MYNRKYKIQKEEYQINTLTGGIVMSDSIWSSSTKVQIPQYEKLTKIKKADVTIVGGGLCGVLCAYLLKDTGAKCILLEGRRVGGGIRDAMAQITSQHGLIYSRLLETQGKEKAAMYLQANEAALQKYRELAEVIECDFEEKSSYIYSKTDRKKIEEEVRAARLLGMQAEFTDTSELPFDTVGAVRFPKQAQLNPLKLFDGLMKELDACDNIQIYEGMRVDEWEQGTTWSGIHVTIPKKIICASHFPFYSKTGRYNNKLYQKRAYILALENAGKLNGIYADEADDGLTLRSYGDLLLMGGGAHRTGKAGCGWDKLREEVAQYYPNAREKAHWAAQDCVSLDGIPYIGPYSEETPDFYVATGFNGWGMTSAMAAALLLTDSILHGENAYGATEKYPWGEVFYPEREILMPAYLSNIKENVLGKLAPSLRRCTHRGGVLKWNPYERSWDCPCHGSRFRDDGKVFNGPALKKAQPHPFSKEAREIRALKREIGSLQAWEEDL